MEFSGMRVIESEWLTQSGEPYQVRRTWGQRLFSRPWRPFQATYTVTPQVPYQGAIRMANNTLVMHPHVVRTLREQGRRETR